MVFFSGQQGGISRLASQITPDAGQTSGKVVVTEGAYSHSPGKGTGVNKVVVSQINTDVIDASPVTEKEQISG